MAPAQGIKRRSDESASAADQVEDAQDMGAQKTVTRAGSPVAQDGPRKKQKTGISMSQKQALIDNLQLEITDRARKLRAQYNLQAQGLRTRIEIRVNRIPMSLRKAKMGDLADRHKQAKPASSFSVLQSARPPPVPAKDSPLARSTSSTSTKSQSTTASRPGPGRPRKRPSDETSSSSREHGGTADGADGARNKARGDTIAGTEASKTTNVLSPASTNVRSLPRPTPAGKPTITRVAPTSENAVGPPKSPVKQSSASNLFSNWAEKARSTRKDAAGKRGNASKSTTASSATGSNSGKTSTTSAKGSARAAATTNARRFSAISESSESSTSTVAKKGTSKAADKKTAPAATKKTGVMNTIKRGVAGAGSIRKTAASKATPASTATGRVLRRRN